jgi:hypothetical protein
MIDVRDKEDLSSQAISLTIRSQGAGGIRTVAIPMDSTKAQIGICSGVVLTSKTATSSN